MCLVPEREFSRAPVEIVLVYLCRFEVRAPNRLLRGFSRQREIRDFRRHEFSSCLSLLMPAGSLLCHTLNSPLGLFSDPQNAPLPNLVGFHLPRFRSFGRRLEPRWIVGA